MKWKRIEGGYEDTTGTYRVTRHEVDDRWDSGALVPYCVQWFFEEKHSDGEFVPVDIYDRLSEGKRAAERAMQRRLDRMGFDQ